jgi:virulence factor Mce-like protein
MGGPPLSRRELFGAITFALGSVIAIVLVWTSFGGRLPFEVAGYRLRLAFPNAPTLVSGASVRIAGVPVGKVVSVSAGASSTDAVIQLDPPYAPLPSDARAIIRAKTPLGESYIELTPGTPGSPPLREGARLPSSQIAPTQQITDLLGTFDAPTRRAFQSVMVDTAASLRGEGPNLNDALGASGPTAGQLDVLLQALDAQSGDVQILISRSTRALRALAANPVRLRGLISAGDQVTASTARRAAAVTATVRALAPFVAQLDRTARPLTQVANLATPTLRTLASVSTLVLPALDSTESLAPRLTDAFVRLRPVIRLARPGLAAAARILSRVPSVGDALDAAGRQLVPLVELLASYDHDAVDSLASFGSVLEPVKGTAGSTGSRYARTAVLFSSEGNLGFAHRQPSSRYNPYPPPGDLGDAKSLGCANTSNPATTPANGSQVPCVTEPPWSFRGVRRSFPLLTPYPPPPLRRRP